MSFAAVRPPRAYMTVAESRRAPELRTSTATVSTGQHLLLPYVERATLSPRLPGAQGDPSLMTSPREAAAFARFEVLLVCRANQCRSPMAEVLLVDAARRLGLDWSISSAGTHASPGAAMSGQALEAVRRFVPDAGASAARSLTADMVRRASIVLTAEVLQRREVVLLEPSALRRTWPLRLFARACGYVSPIDLPNSDGVGAALVRRASDNRWRTHRGGAAYDDIADPIGHSARHFRQCAELIADAVQAILRPVQHSRG